MLNLVPYILLIFIPASSTNSFLRRSYERISALIARILIYKICKLTCKFRIREDFYFTCRAGQIKYILDLLNSISS